MSCPQYLYDELFPIHLYDDTHYAHPLTTNEKLYLALYENAGGDVRKVQLVMEDIVSAHTVHKIKMHLADLGLIQISNRLTPEEGMRFAIFNSNKGLVCEWCGKESYILHRHHYPILASRGGQDTVRICPNCHATYHYIMGDNDTE